MGHSREHISRILAVGSSAPDGIQRLTQGENYVCCQGSDAEHRRLSDFCQDVEELLSATGQELSDFTPEEFAEWILSFADEKRTP